MSVFQRFKKKAKKQEKGNHNNEEQYIYVVEDVSIINDKRVLMGFVQNSHIKVDDHIYIYDDQGIKFETTVEELRRDKVSVNESQSNDYVIIVLSESKGNDIRRGDIITNRKFGNNGVNNYIIKSLLYFVSSLNTERRELKGNVELQNKALREIAHAKHLLAKGSIERHEESVSHNQLNAGDKINFEMISTSLNESYLPLFTYSEETKVEAPTTIVVTYEDAHAIVKNNQSIKGAVINPYTDNIVLTKEYLQYLADQKLKETNKVKTYTVQKDTKILLGKHNDDPQQLKTALIEIAKKEPNINRMWLFLMSKGDELSHLLVVDSSGRREDLFPKIGGVAQDSKLLKGLYLDVIEYGDSFKESATPEFLIYTK